MNAVRGVRVLVTRPAHQADNLCRLLEEAGATALRLPLLKIDAPGDPAAAQALLRQSGNFDWLVFTSVNAVRAAAPWLPTPVAGRPRIACIGAATAAALTAAGFPPALTPESGFTSEDLLASPAMNEVSGLRVLLIRGAGGRDILPVTLTARGARVETAIVYRRVPEAVAPDRVTALLERSDIAIVTSGEILERLLHVTPAESRGRLLTLQLVVPSPRVVQNAIEAGFGPRPLAPASVSDIDFVNLVVAWARDRRSL